MTRSQYWLMCESHRKSERDDLNTCVIVLVQVRVLGTPQTNKNLKSQSDLTAGMAGIQGRAGGTQPYTFVPTLLSALK